MTITINANKHLVDALKEAARLTPIEYSPSTMPVDFPKFPEAADTSDTYNLPAQYFDDLAACAVSAADSEARPVLTSICHRGNQILATDGMRLCQAEQNTIWAQDFNVPAIYAKTLQKAFGKSGAYLSHDDKRVWYKGNGYEISIKQIDGKYPDVSRILPSRHNTQGVFPDIKPWLEALDRVLLFHKQQRREHKREHKRVDREAQNRVDISSDGKGTADLSVRGIGQEFHARLPFTVDDLFVVTVNAQYLKDALQQVGPNARIGYYGPDKPFLLESAQGASHRRKTLVSPISVR